MRPFASAVLLAVLGLYAAVAAAQFKIVDPDGRVTYSDRPDAAAGAKVSTIGREAAAPRAAAASAPSSIATLPFELRAVVERFPVTLYTTGDCAPCERGRRLLQQRGVPFTERLVQTTEDQDALERVVGTRTVPVLAVGAQVGRGWLESEWVSVLDLAGYPAQSRLPRDWVMPPATPLAPRPAGASRPAVPPPPAAPAPPPVPPQPAGEDGEPAPTIRF